MRPRKGNLRQRLPTPRGGRIAHTKGSLSTLRIGPVGDPQITAPIDIRMKPPPSILVSVTLGAAADPYAVSQLAPCVITSRPLYCGCGANAVHAIPGCHSVATAYWSRSM